MTWQQVAQVAACENSVAILPIGATEQHGPHLPLGTDTIMVEWICERAAADLPGVVVAPCIPFGESDNHRAFPGTLSLRLETLKSVICDLGCSLFRAGFDGLFIVNGHGGNTQTVAAAALELREQSRSVVAQVMWTAMVREAWKVMESPIVWHADEAETSQMLAIAPELVHMDRAVSEVPPSVPFVTFTEEALLNVKIDVGLPATHALTHSGTIGEAILARPGKGEAVLSEAVSNLRRTILDLQQGLPSLQNGMADP